MHRPWYSPVIGALRWWCYIACHAVATGLFLLASWALAKLVAELGEPKLYDTVPYRYIIDSVDLALIVEFVVYGAFEARRVFKEQDDD